VAPLGERDAAEVGQVAGKRAVECGARGGDGRPEQQTRLGGAWGGAITAALFLQHFVGDHAWAHLDIAGPALAEKDDGHIKAGGTGYGVLTLYALVESAAGLTEQAPR
jgi:hypothetical protein